MIATNEQKHSFIFCEQTVLTVCTNGNVWRRNVLLNRLKKALNITCF